MVRSITGTLVWVGNGKRPTCLGRRGLEGRKPRRGGPDRSPAGVVPGRRPLLFVTRKVPRRARGLFMKIVHVITRLILGGAQENTLLTVDELHHRYATTSP